MNTCFEHQKKLNVYGYCSMCQHDNNLRTRYGAEQADDTANQLRHTRWMEQLCELHGRQRREDTQPSSAGDRGLLGWEGEMTEEQSAVIDAAVAYFKAYEEQDVVRAERHLNGAVEDLLRVEPWRMLE